MSKTQHRTLPPSGSAKQILAPCAARAGPKPVALQHPRPSMRGIFHSQKGFASLPRRSGIAAA